MLHFLNVPYTTIMTVFSVDEELRFPIIHILKLNKVVASKIGFLETQLSRNQ